MSVSRVLRVLAASTLIVLGFVIQASAQSITGGCTATVNGRAPASLTEKDPLVVRKDERVTLSGGVPAEVAPAGREIRSTTDVYVDIFGFPVKVRTATGKGPTWGGSVELPKLVRELAVGVYRVSGDATGTPGGWKCSGSGYIKLDGNPLTKPATYVAGGMAAGGGALVAGARKPGKRKKNAMGRLVVEAIRDMRKEFGKDLTADLFALAILLIFMILAGPVLAFAAPLAMQGGGGTVRVPGRPVRGFFGGLLFALGLAFVLQQFGFAALDSKMGVAVLASAVVMAVRAWWGSTYTGNPEAPQPAVVPAEPEDPAPPTHEPEPVS